MITDSIVDAITVVLRNDQSTPFRQEEFKRCQGHVNLYAERVLIERELKHIPVKLQSDMHFMAVNSQMREDELKSEVKYLDEHLLVMLKGKNENITEVIS